MPKMSHPNAARPLSVQADEVDRYTEQGWTLIEGTAPAKSEPAPAKTAVKKAVTRKSVSKKS